jgi:hypothetical protein
MSSGVRMFAGSANSTPWDRQWPDPTESGNLLGVFA